MHNDKTEIDLTVVIPNYNNARSIGQTLESLLQQNNLSGFDYEIIVVDNNSTDDSIKIVEQYMPLFQGHLRWVKEAKQGTGAARDKGIQEARGRYIAFTDSDCRMDLLWMSELVRAFREYQADAVVGKIVLATEIPSDIWYPDWFVKQRFAHVDYGDQPIELGADQDLVGANMACRREVFEKLGCFQTNPTFFPCEDTEFSRRISRHGIKKVYQPTAKILHHFEVDRLNEKNMFKQAFRWGRAVILIEPTGLSIARHLLYVIKQMVMQSIQYMGAHFRKDYKTAFFTKCKLYTNWGRCVQLLDKNKVKYDYGP